MELLFDGDQKESSQLIKNMVLLLIVQRRLQVVVMVGYVSHQLHCFPVVTPTIGIRTNSHYFLRVKNHSLPLWGRGHK